jgi:hypothetical protein
MNASEDDLIHLLDAADNVHGLQLITRPLPTSAPASLLDDMEGPLAVPDPCLGVMPSGIPADWDAYDASRTITPCANPAKEANQAPWSEVTPFQNGIATELARKRDSPPASPTFGVKALSPNVTPETSQSPQQVDALLVEYLAFATASSPSPSEAPSLLIDLDAVETSDAKHAQPSTMTDAQKRTALLALVHHHQWALQVQVARAQDAHDQCAEMQRETGMLYDYMIMAMQMAMHLEREAVHRGLSS